jgi:predicted dehydrogenase
MEKQFARTSVELARLVQAVRHNRVTVLAGYPWRFHPVAQDLARLRDEGVFGRALSIESRLVTTQVRPGLRDPDDFLYRRDTEGGGILHMLGGHFLELMRFLAGCEVRAVQAMVGRPVGCIEAPLEDLAILAMEYENGAYGSLHTGYLLACPGGGEDRALVYRGECGWADWVPGSSRLTVRSTAPAWTAVPQRTVDYALAPFHGYGRARWHHAVLQRFVEDVRAGREAALTVEDALHVLQVIEAAYESARSGRRIEVRYGVEAAVSPPAAPAAAGAGPPHPAAGARPAP